MAKPRRIVTRISWETLQATNPMAAGMAMNILFGGPRRIPDGQRLMLEVYLADARDKKDTEEIPYKDKK